MNAARPRAVLAAALFSALVPVVAGAADPDPLTAARAALDAHRYEAALEQFRAILERDPTALSALIGVGLAHAGQAHWSEAIRALEEASRIAPADPEPYYYLTHIYFNNHQYEDAVKTAGEAVRRAPDNEDYRYFLAQLLDRTGRQDEAIREWQWLVSRTPRTARYLLPLAASYHRKGEVLKAIEILREAARAQPDSSLGRLAAGILKDLETKHRRELRLAELKRELDFTPRNPDLHFELAGLYFEEKRWAAAEEAVQRAIALAPARPEYHALRARIADGQERKLEAVAALEEAVRLAPENARIRLSLSGFYLQVNRRVEAVSGLKRVIEEAPGTPEATFAQRKLQELAGEHGR